MSQLREKQKKTKDNSFVWTDDELKRKLPVDNQLLNVSQEELKIKKQLLERMDNMDKAHLNHMEKLTNNMEKLTGSISEGF
ncbi:unnamed protein product, partial [Porites evermanni]